MMNANTNLNMMMIIMMMHKSILCCSIILVAWCSLDRRFLFASSQPAATTESDVDALLDIDGSSIIPHGNYLCAIESKHGVDVGGKLFCWSDREEDPLIPDPEKPREETFIQIAGGDYFGCGITLDQSLTCWGMFAPENVPGLYKQIDVATAYFCGIRVDGSLYCFGNSDVTRVVPQYPATLKFKQVSCAPGHCCLIDQDDYPHCFGLVENKEIRPPFHDDYDVENENDIEDEEEEAALDLDEKLRMAKQKKLKKFRQISAGRQYTCGITMDNDIHCWGEHRALFKKYPRTVKGPFRQISVGGVGVCALRGGGSGGDDGDEGSSSSDKKLSGGEVEDGLGEVEEGGSKDIDSKNSQKGIPNTLVCWGPIANSVPIEDANKEWDQIKLGDYGACAVSMDSELTCWGSDFRNMPKGIIVA